MVLSVLVRCSGALNQDDGQFVVSRRCAVIGRAGRAGRAELTG